MSRIFDVNKHKPDESVRILVLNNTSLHINGMFREVEPVWSEAYYYEGSWRLWCGKIGTISSRACEFKYWSKSPSV